MMRRPTRRLVLVTSLLAIIGIGIGFVVRAVYFPSTTITANFSSTTGIYPGDEVRIAGVRVGTIRSITPQPGQVAVSLDIDHDIRVPADAKAVVVAQNLIAARYIQLAPLYQPGQPQMTDGATIPLDRTAVPIEWDEVKTQLSRLATELGPDSSVSDTSVGRFIESTADAMDGNGAKLRETFAQLSKLARILTEGSGDIVATIENLATFVASLRDSNEELVLFGDRLATFSTVLDDSRSDLHAAMSELAVAVGEVQRFVAGTRDKTSEQVQRLASVTQVLADQRVDLENILHIAPTAFANAYNILNPNLPGAVGTFVLNNFSNPVAFICSAIGGIANVTAPETGKLCANYLGPALRLLNLNYPPIPLNPLLAPTVTPDKIAYADPALAPGGTGTTPAPPEQPPSISAYTGLNGDVASPPGSSPAPSSVPEMLLPAEVPALRPPLEGTPTP